MLSGCHTALIAPFQADKSLDQDGLEKLVAFQISEGIHGIITLASN